MRKGWLLLSVFPVVLLLMFLNWRSHRRAVVNPRGVQFDYIWTDDNGYDSSWDAVWDSWGKVTPEGYVVLISIPFKSLRFANQPQQTWGILFERLVPHDFENSFYPRISSSIQGRLSQEAELEGLAGINPGRNLQLNP